MLHSLWRHDYIHLRAPKTDRVQKLKDARLEAEKEIKEYKSSKEAEFKEFERSVCRETAYSLQHIDNAPQRDGTTQTSQSAIDKETEVKLEEISKAYLANKDKVVKKLLDRVVLVKPELHRNLRKVERAWMQIVTFLLSYQFIVVYNQWEVTDILYHCCIDTHAELCFFAR